MEKVKKVYQDIGVWFLKRVFKYHGGVDYHNAILFFDDYKTWHKLCNFVEKSNKIKTKFPPTPTSVQNLGESQVNKDKFFL